MTDRRFPDRRRRDQQDRDRRSKYASDAEWIARNFPSRAAPPPAADPLVSRVADLVGRGLTDIAWKIVAEQGKAPERYGLYQDYDEEEWASIRHYVDASNARYRFEWQVGDLFFPPSTCIDFGFLVRAYNYQAILPLDRVLGACAKPFDEPYAGTRQRSADTCLLNAYHWRRLVVEHARQRWTDGFYADPFAIEPMRRPA